MEDKEGQQFHIVRQVRQSEAYRRSQTPTHRPNRGCITVMYFTLFVCGLLHTDMANFMGTFCAFVRHIYTTERCYIKTTSCNHNADIISSPLKTKTNHTNHERYREAWHLVGFS